MSDQCQRQTSTVNDLLIKVRQLETAFATVQQQNMYSVKRLIEMEDKQNRLEEELREMKDQVSGVDSLRNETNGKMLYYHFR